MKIRAFSSGKSVSLRLKLKFQIVLKSACKLKIEELNLVWDKPKQSRGKNNSVISKQTTRPKTHLNVNFWWVSTLQKCSRDFATPRILHWSLTRRQFEIVEWWNSVSIFAVKRLKWRISSKFMFRETSPHTKYLKSLNLYTEKSCLIIELAHLVDAHILRYKTLACVVRALSCDKHTLSSQLEVSGSHHETCVSLIARSRVQQLRFKANWSD